MGGNRLKEREGRQGTWAREGREGTESREGTFTKKKGLWSGIKHIRVISTKWGIVGWQPGTSWSHGSGAQCTLHTQLHTAHCTEHCTLLTAHCTLYTGMWRKRRAALNV